MHKNKVIFKEANTICTKKTGTESLKHVAKLCRGQKAVYCDFKEGDEMTQAKSSVI